MSALAIARVDDPASAAVTALLEGRMVAVWGTADERQEAMLCAVAGSIGEDTLNAMISEGGGLVCVALYAARCAELELRAAGTTVPEHGAPTYLNTVEARSGVTTGISVADRVRTVRTLGSRESGPADLATPGHVVPIRVSEPVGGPRSRCAEAALDLVALVCDDPSAGAVLVHALDAHGDVTGLAGMSALAVRTGMPLVSAGDIADLRRRAIPVVERVAQAPLDTPAGRFEVVTYRDRESGASHFAVLVGASEAAGPRAVRVLAQDPLAHALGAGSEVADALRRLQAAGDGVLLYLAGADATADASSSYVAAHILRDLDVDAVRTA